MRRQREKEINPIEVKLNIRTGRMEKQFWRCHRAIVITGNRPKIVKCRRCDSLNQLIIQGKVLHLSHGLHLYDPFAGIGVA